VLEGLTVAIGSSILKERITRVQLSCQRSPQTACQAEELQWLDAATLDKAVDMKVKFYAPHLKGWP
jgi:hypothetical protein